MTTFRADNNQLRNNVPSEKIPPGEARGVVRVAYDSFDLSAALTDSDVLKGPLIPKGARVHDVIMKFDDMGSTGVFDIGWAASEETDSDGSAIEAADQNGFADSIDVNTAAGVYQMADDAPSVAGLGKEFDAEVELEVTPTTSGDATSGNIKLWVYYSVE